MFQKRELLASAGLIAVCSPRFEITLDYHQLASSPFVPQVADLAKKGHYQLACARYYEVTHNVDRDSVSINHPNEYFDLSRHQNEGMHACVEIFLFHVDKRNGWGCISEHLCPLNESVVQSLSKEE